MPPQIPSPIISGGRGSSPLLQRLALSLAPQLFGFGLRQLTEEPSAAEEQVEVQRTEAFEDVLRAPESGAASRLAQQGLGNAAVPTEELTPSIERERLGAPAELQRVQQKREAAAQEEAFGRIHGALVEKFGADSPEVEAFEVTAAGEQIGLGTEERERLSRRIAPTVQEQLENTQAGLGLALLSGDIKGPGGEPIGTEAAFALGQDSIAAAAAIEEAGLGPTFRTYLNADFTQRRQIDRLFRQQALDIQSRNPDLSLPTGELMQFLRTGKFSSEEARDRALPWMSRLEAERRAARLGTVTKLMQSPAASVLMSLTKTAFEEGDEEEAAKNYRKLRTMIAESGAASPDAVDAMFPKIVGERVTGLNPVRLFPGPQFEGLDFVQPQATRTAARAAQQNEGVSGGIGALRTSIRELEEIEEPGGETKRLLNELRSAMDILERVNRGELDLAPGS